MATLDDLSTALRNADAAGDVDAARALAAEITKMQTGGAASTALAATAPPPGDTSGWGIANALTGGMVRGVPIVGPSIDTGVRKFGAGVRSMINGTPYDDELKAVNQYVEATKATNPRTETAGNIAGSVGALAPLGMTALGARLLGMTGTLPARVVQGGIGGAAISAADSAARGRDSIGTDAAVGAGISAAVPVAGRAAGALYENFVKRTGIPQAIAGYATTARDKVARAMGDDAVTPQAMREIGPQGMLLDAGPNLRLQGEALATQPGQANRIVSDAVTSRHQAAGGRIRNEVDATLGPYTNFRDTQQAAIAARRASGNQLYTAAFENAQPVNIGPAIQAIDDVIRPGIPAHVPSQGGPAPDSIQAVLTRVRDVLGGNGAQRIDARNLHTVKMDLDDMIDSAVRSGKNNQARLLGTVRDRVVTGLEESTGGAEGLYAQARRQYRSDSQVINALDDGRALFNKATRPDDLVAAVRDMSAAERAAFRIGSRDAVDEIMGTVANDALAARTLFAKDWNERKLRAVIGDEQAQRLLSTIGREDTFAQTYGAVQRGSQTRGRMAAGEEFPSTVEGVPQLLRGQSLYEETVRRPVNWAVGQFRTDAARQAANREGSDAARILTLQGGPRDEVIEALLNMTARGNAARATGSSIDNALTIAGQGTQPRVSPEIVDALMERSRKREGARR
jgi:hypothetical protein